MKTSHSVHHLGTSYIILKVSSKNREKNRRCLDCGKEREAQGKNEGDMEGKEKEGREQMRQT